MEMQPSRGYRARLDALSRRRLLQLSGSLGLAATLGACAGGTESTSTPTAQPASTAPALPPEPIAVSPQPLEPGLPTAKMAGGQPMVEICRRAWGAAPARAGGRPHTITRMTLHHTAVVLGDNRNAPSRLRQHQQYHQNDRGWIDIAYHVGVDRNGNIYELRSPELAGDTATNYDPAGHFLVLCEGDFDQETVSEAQLNGAATAFAWAAQQFRLASGTLGGHRDFADTACPGANLYSHLTSGDLHTRIDALLAAGPVDLLRLCGEEAATKVAAIEAGQ
ncbi:N-acetylmuramoyl-L-alanine amidase [Mycolicibacterium setense]|uniref:peptidoglycan recognition protein family protein n=3 Tax=Mycolicibacterium setense TaxID=431269 RepID=UPI00068FFF9B|nr:peptidoglycan recognition family protein [Mycolicibacterium setense]MCV7114504.1 N-acetylmuramoyl-L-alanine amidase [Mycolicibacterium setense]